MVTAVDCPSVMEATVSLEGLSGWLKPQKHALEHMGPQEPLRVQTTGAAEPLTNTGSGPFSLLRGWNASWQATFSPKPFGCQTQSSCFSILLALSKPK